MGVHDPGVLDGMTTMIRALVRTTDVQTTSRHSSRPLVERLPMA